MLRVRRELRHMVFLVGPTLVAIAGCSQPTAAPPVTSAPPQRVDQDDQPAATPDATPDKPPPQKPPQWTSLFDGESLGNWRSTQFGGEAEVTVEDGAILMPNGEDMTGITWRGEPPARMDYEIEVEARRVDGHDFFCGLTFPVGNDYCSLICGGWGGIVTGLSSLDWADASHNETRTDFTYDNKRWYLIRVRVTENRIQAWVDDKRLVDADTTGRKIGIRGEVEPSKPLGIATWRTTGAVRAIRIRKLNDESSPTH
jgi:hypothetical protein